MSFLKRKYLLVYSFSILTFLFFFMHLSAENETRALKRTYDYWFQKFSQAQTPSKKTEILFEMIQEAVRESAQDEKVIYLLLANDGPRLCGGAKGDQAEFKRLLRSIIRESHFESLDDPTKVAVVQMIPSLYQMEGDVLDEVFLFELRRLIKKGLDEWNWSKIDEETKKDFILNYNNINGILGPEVSYHVQAKVIEMQKMKSRGKVAMVVEWELIEAKRIHNPQKDKIEIEKSTIESNQIEEFLDEKKAKTIEGDYGTKNGLSLEREAAITLFRNLSKTANIRENPAPEADKIGISNWDRLVPRQSSLPETSKTYQGAVFTHDTSYPKLGEAWRDPDDLIWGDIVKKTDGTIYYMNKKNATNYCASIGARLPSNEEFFRLLKYMETRSETHNGYSAQVLPNLSDHNCFWSSTVYSNPDFAFSANIAYFFDGSNGSIGYGGRQYNRAVRCVGIPWPIGLGMTEWIIPWLISPGFQQ